ncbi:LysR family transcriptional regulator [Paraburkholderia dipogonis]|uniref:LysR family transcriptional regulator n=1 Tax=Paraburkholderia dipogonis TaxID=1211383 RepID=UPI0035EA9EB4
MDHLQAIRIFARVVETGGFGRAAQSLQMPNANRQQVVKSLEDHLGVKLLERKHAQRQRHDGRRGVLRAHAGFAE